MIPIYSVIPIIAHMLKTENIRICRETIDMGEKIPYKIRERLIVLIYLKDIHKLL